MIFCKIVTLFIFVYFLKLKLYINKKLCIKQWLLFFKRSHFVGISQVGQWVFYVQKDN